MKPSCPRNGQEGFLPRAARALVLFELTVLLSLSFPSAALPVEATEMEIQNALDAEFKKMGPRAHILTGTLLYLYYPHRSKYYNINSLGFRGGELRARKKNTFCVAVLGGSTVFGSSQADDQTIPYFLERGLQKSHPELDVQVCNLGIEGYTIQREIALAKLLRDRVKPDLVIFYDGWNDMSMAYHIDYKDLSVFEGEDETFFAKKQGEKSLPEAIIDMSSRIWRRVSGPAWWSAKKPDLAGREKLFHEGYLRYLRQAGEYFANSSIPVLFVIQPTLATRKNRAGAEKNIADSSEYHFPGRMGFVCRCVSALRETDEFKRGTLCDASGVFDRSSGEFFRDAAHINEAGNRIVAAHLSEIVEESGHIAKKR